MHDDVATLWSTKINTRMIEGGCCRGRFRWRVCSNGNCSCSRGVKSIGAKKKRGIASPTHPSHVAAQDFLRQGFRQDAASAR